MCARKLPDSVFYSVECIGLLNKADVFYVVEYTGCVYRAESLGLIV